VNSDPARCWLRGPAAAAAVDRTEATLRVWTVRGYLHPRKVRVVDPQGRARKVNIYNELELLTCDRDRRMGER
jgi:hypothetical protein